MIRLMREADLVLADRLREMAGWNQTIADWQRLFRYEPDGCFVAEREGIPVATATTTSYGSALAWIGMVLVHPEHRRQGLGTALLRHCLDHLARKGVGCVKLDATPQAQPLYERLGFRPEWTLQRWEAKQLAPFECLTSGEMHEAEAAFEAEQLDTIAFGVDRSRFLQALRAGSQQVVVSGKPHPALGMIRAGSRAFYLGPVLAKREEIALTIVREMLRSVIGKPVYWDIPDHQSKSIALARELGFVPQRTLIRMFYAARNVAGKPEFVFGITGPETG